MVKKLWRYVKPFSSDTGTLRTDGRTDGQICYINIARQYTDARWYKICCILSIFAASRVINEVQWCAAERHLCITRGRSTQSDAYHHSVDGTLLTAVMGQTFVENRDFFWRAMLCISAAIAGTRYLSVCPSVCLSVTFVSCAKTNTDIFEIFSPSGSQAILVFPCQTGWR